MPRGSQPAPPRAEPPAGLRELAAHARRHAEGADEDANTRLTAFAAELEARAAALELPVQTIDHQAAAAMKRSDPALDQS